MRTAILTGLIFIGSQLEFMRNRELEGEDKNADAWFGKFTGWILLGGIAMDVIEFFTRVL